MKQVGRSMQRMRDIAPRQVDKTGGKLFSKPLAIGGICSAPPFLWLRISVPRALGLVHLKKF